MIILSIGAKKTLKENIVISAHTKNGAHQDFLTTMSIIVSRFVVKVCHRNETQSIRVSRINVNNNDCCHIPEPRPEQR